MRIIAVLMVMCLLCVSLYAVDTFSPECLTAKKYFYETRCTCGLLFERHETDLPEMDGLISHTICYDCLLKSIKGSGFTPSQKLLDTLLISTLSAKLLNGYA